MSDSVWRKLHLEGREVLHHQSGQVSIFTEGEQVFLVQRVDVDFGIFVDNPGRDDDGSTLVGRTNSINTETTGQTGDGTEKTFERLSQVV